jgi:hypothetical protein
MCGLHQNHANLNLTHWFQLFDDHFIPFYHHQKHLFPLIGHVFKAKPFQTPFILHLINNWSKTSFKSCLLVHLCRCVVVDSLLGRTMILDLVYKSTPWFCIICHGLIFFAHKKNTKCSPNELE